MYEPHFGLTSDPFRLTPSSRPCFEHRTYRRALAYLAYASGRHDGVLMLTGGPGTGKSSAIRAFIDSVGDPALEIVQIVCAAFDGDDLLRTIAQRFGAEVEGAGRGQLYERLEARFVALHEQGRRALLIIDEAQGLALEALEQVRLLTNFQRDDDVLLQVFLVGQPELRTLVGSPGLEQLQQRVIVASQLKPLTESEATAYVEHCLRESGWQGRPSFDENVHLRIHAEAHGVPRRINLIMSRLLLHAMVHRLEHVTEAQADAVLGGLRSEGLLAFRAGKQEDESPDDAGDEAR